VSAGPSPAGAERPGRELAALFVGSRAGLLVLALFAIRLFPLNAYNRDHNSAFAVRPPPAAAAKEPPVAPDQAAPPLSRDAEPRGIAVWARWDALWYARIAEVGYAGRFAVDDLPGKYGEPPATGFFPLMPLAMRMLSPLAGTPLRAGLLISNLSLLLSMWLLYRLTLRLIGAEAAVGAVSLLLVYPPGFFLSAPYAESLGLALALATVSLSLDGRFAAAGAAGFLAALARPTGVLLAPVILLQWWSTRRREGRAAGWSGALASLAPAAGLAAFLLYCGRAFGDPWAPFHRQETWRGAMTWPPAILQELSGGPLSLMAPRRSLVELAAAVAFLALGALAFRYLPPAIALYGLATTLVPLTTSLFSFSRLALASFPVFMTAGAILRGRPALRRGIEVFFALLLAAYAILYFSWNWIG
jgi:hypothetical protein